MHLSRDHTELLSALNEHHVRYLVIGGYAVGVHSEPRATKDLDVFIRSDESNAIACFRALAQFGAPLAGVTPQDLTDGKSFLKMGVPPERIDVLQAIDGVTFDECWPDRVYAEVHPGLQVPVISAAMLIRNKRSSDRPQDRADVHAIQRARRAVQGEPL